MESRKSTENYCFIYIFEFRFISIYLPWITSCYVKKSLLVMSKMFVSEALWFMYIYIHTSTCIFICLPWITYRSVIDSSFRSCLIHTFIYLSTYIYIYISICVPLIPSCSVIYFRSSLIHLYQLISTCLRSVKHIVWVKQE